MNEMLALYQVISHLFTKTSSFEVRQAACPVNAAGNRFRTDSVRLGIP